MKFKFDIPEELKRGAELLNDTPYSIKSDNGGYPVKAIKKEGLNGFKIEAEDNGAVIYYDTVSRFFYALSHVAAKEGKAFSLEKHAKAKRIGIMRDCARNAVLSVKGAKDLAAAAALTGYNYLELYAEDLMEIEKYPYLGQSRGRYKGAEIKEIREYAEAFGIELVPCIQTLAHLPAIFLWDAFDDIHDRDDILLVDEEKTYEFIDAVLDFCEKNFTSRRINIGMDEAYNMFLGKYLDKHGYVSNRAEVFMRHLNRVLELCRKHGFKPSMWSDMIFKAALGGRNPEAYKESKGEKFDPEFVKNFPKDVTIIYWDYYNFDKKSYDANFKRHYSITNNVSFAGGVWTWVGFAPLSTAAEKSAEAAIKSGVDNGCEDYLFTAWGDMGGEASTFAALSSFSYAAERLYGVKGSLTKELNARLTAVFGNSYADFKNTENLNKPFKTGKSELKGRDKKDITNVAKYALYNDPLIGRADMHVTDEMTEGFKKCAREMRRAARKGGAFSYVFETLYRLADLLSVRANLGRDIYAAYHKGDTEKLKEIAEKKIPAIIRKLNAFYEAHRTQWLKENKSLGFEVSDIRIGGLLMRLKETRRVIKAYLLGEITEIEELEQKRLPLTTNLKEGDAVCNQHYTTLMTGSII